MAPTRPSSSSSGPRWSGKALAAVVAWGASFVAMRIALETWTPFGVALARMALGAITLGAVALRSRGPAALRAAVGPTTIALGIVLVVHTLLQLVGLRYTSAVKTGWIIGFTGVPIALGGWWFLGQRVRRVGWLGVAVAAAGIVGIVQSVTPGFAQARTGDLLQLGSCFTWTVFSLAGQRAVSRHGSLVVTAVALGAGAVLLAPGLALTPVATESIGPRQLAAVVFLGCVCSGAAYSLWGRAIAEHGAARTGSYLYLEPFVTIVLASSLLAEPISTAVVLYGLVVLLGVVLVARGT